MLVDLIDPTRFLLWYDDEYARLALEENNPTLVMSRRLGLGEEAMVRQVYRWRNEGKQATREFIVKVLDHAGIDIGDVYPELAVDVALEVDAFCPRCHEIVTPIAGECPWCDGPVKDKAGRDKGFCTACNTMMSRNGHGECWRCGTRIQSGIPIVACACDCGEMISQFDGHGRRKRYVHGHAPRSLERRRDVATEPFARYLERRLHELDPISALAREHGIARADVVAVLRRDEPVIEREVVRRALWVFGTNGTGMPRRPDSTSFFELYPGDGRSRICPHCKQGKAPHAEMCKKCRRLHDPTYMRGGPPSQSRLTPEVIDRARTLIGTGKSVAATAQIIFDDTAYASVDSLQNALRLAGLSR